VFISVFISHYRRSSMFLRRCRCLAANGTPNASILASAHAGDGFARVPLTDVRLAPAATIASEENLPCVVLFSESVWS
jgi:hypothetical protein